MGFGSFLGGFLGDSFSSDFTGGLLGSDYLKDYQHASKTFLSDGYANVPQFKFLFHVYFTLNTGEIPGLAGVMPLRDNATIGLMVRTAELPSYNLEVKEMNQYNRRRYVQTGIKYNPVNISFHDDGSDLVRSMWYNYMTYYFADSRHEYDGQSTGGDTNFNFNKRDIYDNIRSVNDWGFTGDNVNGSYKPHFFKDIKIYGLNRGNFVQYTLVNPIITSWQHDTFDYTQGDGTMTNTMTVNYEAVKYQRGNIGGLDTTEVKGFGMDEHYDRTPSSLSKPGSGLSIFGEAGLLDAGSSIIEDLVPGGDGKVNFLNAGLTAFRTGRNFRDADLGNLLKTEVVAEAGKQAKVALTSGVVAGALGGFSFPKSTKNNSTPSTATTVNSNNNQTSAQNLGSVNTNAQSNPNDVSRTAPSDVSSNNSAVTSPARPPAPFRGTRITDDN